MNHKVQAYINKINADDPTLRGIYLEDLGLGDTDIVALMMALTSKPNVAQRIIELHLDGNQLTLINIPATLVALKELHLSDNQLTSIKISEALVRLQSLGLDNNQLTSINIPATLTELQRLNLEGNQLTMATTIALESLRRMPGNNNFQVFYANPVPAATQLTADMLEEHFEAMKDVLASELSSPAVKFAILNCAWQGNIRVGWECLPFELIDMALEMHGLGATGLLGKEIANFSTVFANDEQKMATLTQWLSSSDMNYFKKNIMGKQYETIKSLTNEYRQNIRKASKDIKERLKLTGNAEVIIPEERASFKRPRYRQ